MAMTNKELEQDLKKCVRCGRCLSSCPVYKQTLWEGSVARGKLSFLKAALANEEDLGDRMKDLLSHCLLCGACAEGCASGVMGDELIRAGRCLAVKDDGLAWIKSRLLKDVLSRGALTQGLWKSRDLFIKKVPRQSGLHFRFLVPGLEKERWLPQPAARSFLEGLATRQGFSNLSKGSPKVALFVGCVANYLRPETAGAAVKMLEAAGAGVIIPAEQVCCGKPAHGAGDDETALFLARKNLQVFSREKYDFIVTFCATCSEQLKHYAGLTGLPGTGFPADRIKDISELLVADLKWKPLNAPDAARDPLRVFYHDPCHLRRKQGIYQQPRQLIESLPGVELVGGDAPPVCCGYGGIFNLWHYRLSQNLFKTRAESIIPHNPDLVVTSCSGCWLQFQDGSKCLGSPFQIAPLVELVAARGLGSGDPDQGAGDDIGSKDR